MIHYCAGASKTTALCDSDLATCGWRSCLGYLQQRCPHAVMPRHQARLMQSLAALHPQHLINVAWASIRTSGMQLSRLGIASRDQKLYLPDKTKCSPSWDRPRALTGRNWGLHDFFFFFLNSEFIYCPLLLATRHHSTTTTNYHQ